MMEQIHSGLYVVGDCDVGEYTLAGVGLYTLAGIGVYTFADVGVYTFADVGVYTNIKPSQTNFQRKARKSIIGNQFFH